MDHQNFSAPACALITPAEQLNELFATTYRQYRPMVRNTILGRLGLYGTADTHLAEDLTQNTFLAFYQRLHNTTAVHNAGGLLRVMARQSVGHHYRAMRNRYEQPADTGHWTFANRELGATAAGYYTPAATGFRTATWSDDDNKPVIPRIPGPRTPQAAAYPGDSDPNPDEALRRVQGRPAPTRQSGGAR